MFMSTQLVGAFLFHSVCSLLSTVADTFTRLWITRPLAGPTKVTSVYPGYVVVTDITIGYESRYSGHVDPAVGALLMTFETAHTWLPGVGDTKSRTGGGGWGRGTKDEKVPYDGSGWDNENNVCLVANGPLSEPRAVRFVRSQLSFRLRSNVNMQTLVSTFTQRAGFSLSLSHIHRSRTSTHKHQVTNIL